jgi:FkbM family methyltransferase
MKLTPISEHEDLEHRNTNTMSAPIFSEVYVGESLLKWRVAHEMSVRLEDDALIVSDTALHSYHLLRVHNSEFVFRVVRLRCVLKKLPTSAVNFYVHHYGLMDVAEIALDGTILNKGPLAKHLSVVQCKEGLIEVDLEYLSFHPTLSIGTSSGGHPVYSGFGRAEVGIVRIEVETRDAALDLSRISQEERIRLIDVGGAEGLQLKWMLRADRITPVLFEPIASEAEMARRVVSRIPGGLVIENALSNTSETRKLHVAVASGCSSLREPNFEFLNKYSIGQFFRITGETDVLCTRYDQLFRMHRVPVPDVIKIDVQGFEYEVLLGFGHLLECCLGIELESHMYPVYHGEKVFGDIVGLLADFGFVLRRAQQVPNFDGDSVEFDLFFTKRREAVLRLGELEQKKFALLTEVWELPRYSN